MKIDVTLMPESQWKNSPDVALMIAAGIRPSGVPPVEGSQHNLACIDRPEGTRADNVRHHLGTYQPRCRAAIARRLDSRDVARQNTRCYVILIKIGKIDKSDLPAKVYRDLGVKHDWKSTASCSLYSSETFIWMN